MLKQLQNLDKPEIYVNKSSKGPRRVTKDIFHSSHTYIYFPPLSVLSFSFASNNWRPDRFHVSLLLRVDWKDSRVLYLIGANADWKETISGVTSVDVDYILNTRLGYRQAKGKIV